MKSLDNISWWKLQWKVPSLIEESLIWKLQSIGINSFYFEIFPEDRLHCLLNLWLLASEWTDKDRIALEINLYKLADIFGISLEESPTWLELADEEWNSVWKKYWKPDPIGLKLLILPSWLNCPQEFCDRHVVRIDPGSAFGTGSHPSTRLCLEALERLSVNDSKILDLGCGSGILGIAAISLGAEKVFALDIDGLAIRSAQQNAFLNGLTQEKLFIYKGSIDSLSYELQKTKVDLLICNILAPVIKELAYDFKKVLCPDGYAILSGLLVSQIEDITEFLKELGWTVVGVYHQEKWALIQVCRNQH